MWPLTSTHSSQGALSFFYFIFESVNLFSPHLPRFLCSEFLRFILAWEDEQDEYFLTPFHCQFIHCANFLEYYFFGIYRILYL